MADSMDTFEARQRMRELAVDGLGVVNRLACGEWSRREAIERSRELATEARAVLTDAGYPGEATWRVLQRVLGGLSSMDDPPHADYWEDVRADLTDACDALDRLLAVPDAMDADFRIVG